MQLGSQGKVLHGYGPLASHSPLVQHFVGTRRLPTGLFDSGGRTDGHWQLLEQRSASAQQVRHSASRQTWLQKVLEKQHCAGHSSMQSITPEVIMCLTSDTRCKAAG